ncbi:nicotinate-nucleotide pyrophosphorylase [carboxylating] [Desulfocicer vacuolatum DSM 3385]|uniref:Probable nicotinate-nucleotide pyrophosphorylase [carboxylating] n=1 Tax=Desulfocicer vacuolatum DSM 3385 TaxID=1121400 RepID=A0A1W2AQT6_9BACT|nr:carboxylating nicotinate-nucleotide diphosphorylase [Desulfocicer vacuolatum]SMC63076.1 nicotinate-nucleotide pyrophosphorylase [carboxylating] [Desulfocicer vacuolatum DSM 3385]
MFDNLLKMAFEEDLGTRGDVTSDAVFDDHTDVYWLVAKQAGILCGVDCFTKAFAHVDETCKIEWFFFDGDALTSGDKVARISGSIQSILRAERVALNFLSHLSGIATRTREYVNALSGKTRLLDTRKTLPGWRSLQKYAVTCGGGTNHRMGLHDMVMIKDNHVDGAGGIEAAVKKVRAKWGDQFRVEVETRTLDEVSQAISAGVDVIMLDNMDIPTMTRAVALINGRAETEASGNMDLSRMGPVSCTGVDYISVGALTHSVTVFDFSIKQL